MQFSFPGWELSVERRGAGAGGGGGEAPGGGGSGPCGDDLLGDLQARDLDLSDDGGGSEPEEPCGPARAARPDAPAGQAAGAGAPAGPSGAAGAPERRPAPRGGGAALPSEVLLLVLCRPGIGVRDLANAMAACAEWRAVVADSAGLWAAPLRAALPSAPAAAAGAAAATSRAGAAPRGGAPAAAAGAQEGEQRRRPPQQPSDDAAAAGAGAPPPGPELRLTIRRAPPPPPWRLPPGLLPADPLLHLRAWRSISNVAARWGCLRKGFEYLADAFGAIWVAVSEAAGAAEAAGAGGGSGGGGGGGRRLTHVDQLWQGPAGGERLAVDDRYNARAVQRMVGKLAAHDWQLLYSGFCALLDAKAAEVALALRRGASLAPSAPPGPAESAVHGSGGGGGGGRSPGAERRGGGVGGVSVGGVGGGGAEAWDAGGLLRGGLLADMEAVMEGASARFAAEPDVLLAACGQGPRPDAGAALCGALLRRWDEFRRALDLFVSRCGPLGARVEAARQEMLAGPAPRGGGGGGGAALAIPHLLNRGLLSFRSGVLLAYGVRRPTQSALAWLAARARDGDSDLPPADASLLDRARKMLTELDVYDDGTQPAPAHTHGKFAAAFGALLLRDRRSERLGLRER